MVVGPLAAYAQQPQRRLGALMIGAEDEPDSKLRIDGFLKGLRDLGWKDGENLHIEYRWAAGRQELIQKYAEELVALVPDVILANGAPVMSVLKPLTRSIPIVFANVFDPVGFGLVDSLARPGGNITGFTFIAPELIGKWTELLKEAAPQVTRAAFLYNPKINAFYPGLLRELKSVPQSVSMEIRPTSVETLDDLKAKFRELAGGSETGVMIGPDGFLIAHIGAVARLASASRVAGISVYREFAVEGGLMAYGPDVPDTFRRSAAYVDRILKGAKPADLPVQQPTKFQFAVNQKAASALGLTLSPTLLALADEVIE